MQAEHWLSAVKLLKKYSSIADEDWELSWKFAWYHFKICRLRVALRPAFSYPGASRYEHGSHSWKDINAH